jgi:hypothetical protein
VYEYKKLAFTEASFLTTNVRWRTVRYTFYKEEKPMSLCSNCNDTGIVETGNNDLPCDQCPAGEVALFNLAYVDGPVTGAEMRRHFFNGSPEPIEPCWPPIPASKIPGRL